MKEVIAPRVQKLEHCYHSGVLRGTHSEYEMHFSEEETIALQVLCQLIWDKGHHNLVWNEHSNPTVVLDVGTKNSTGSLRTLSEYLFTPMKTVSVPMTMIVASNPAKLGCNPDVCSVLWEMISSKKERPQLCKPKHLLWTLLFVKVYAPGTILAEMVGTSRDIYAKWVWIVLKLIAGVLDDVVIWANRLKTDSRNKYCMVTVDGTDFRIQEPTPFSPMWYSHKFKGPGL